MGRTATATAAVLLQQEQERQQLVARISSWLFDALQASAPPELAVRLKYPRCPFCKRRPELTVVRGQDLIIASRPGSATVNIPRYQVLPCCSANYRVKHEGPSRLERRRTHERGASASRKGS